MATRNWRWTDAHFCSLPSQTSLYKTCGITTTPQTNVYGHAKVIEPDGTNKLLVASLAGKLLSVEYQRSSNKLKPSTKEIQFTYIPGGAELISMDVASRTCKGNNGLIVGITFIKQKNQLEDSENTCMQYLNLYSACQPGEEYLESVSQGCFSIELDFVPYQLTHTTLVTDNGMETVFLLSGNDNQVHIYRETQDQIFSEETIEIYFPELHCPASSILWLDIVYFDGHKRRITAQGQRSGHVFISLVDAENREVIQGWEVQHDSPITNLQIFTPENQVQCPSFLNLSTVKSGTKDGSTMPVYNLLVISALEPAVVYRDVLSLGLSDPCCLPHSCSWDIPLSACIVDIDFDGQNEILIGTYGQELLAYKLTDHGLPRHPVIGLPSSSSCEKLSTSQTSSESSEQLNSRKQRHHSNEIDANKVNSSDNKISPRKSISQENLSSSLRNSISDSSKANECDVIDEVAEGQRKISYDLIWQRSFSSPVMGVDKLDIMGDGMDDLVVVTLRGVHIIQPDINEVAKVCLERMRQLTVTSDTSVGDEEQIVISDSGVGNEDQTHSPLAPV